MPASAGFQRSSPHMPDPTEFVIVTTFGSALGIFALAATARMLRDKAPMMIAVPDDFPFAGEDSPYSPPEPTATPPAIPVGRVPTWFYQPLDLLGLAFIYLVFFSLVVSSIRSSSKTEPTLDSAGLIVSIAFQFISAGIVSVFVITRVRPIEWLGLKWPGWRWVFVIAPGAVLAMWLFFAGLQLSGLMQWIESFGVDGVQDTVKLLQNATDPVLIGLMTLAAVVAAPICEEIVFRGYLYPAAKKFVGPWVAGICSALVFAAAHGSLAALLPLFIFGCVLVFIYEKTGSLWAPCAVHFCFNGATVLVQLLARYHHISLDAPL